MLQRDPLNAGTLDGLQPLDALQVAAWGRYEPGIHRTYAELAAQQGTTILPARPAAPRDKAVAEVAVSIAEGRIVARLR